MLPLQSQNASYQTPKLLVLPAVKRHQPDNMPSRAGFVSSRASVPSVDTPRANPTSRQTRPFSPEPQETPLNQNALFALETLKRRDASSSNSSGFDAALNRAAELLTEVV